MHSLLGMIESLHNDGGKVDIRDGSAGELEYASGSEVPYCAC